MPLNCHKYCDMEEDIGLLPSRRNLPTRHGEDIFNDLLIINKSEYGNQIVPHFWERDSVYPKGMYYGELHMCRTERGGNISGRRT